MKNILEKVGIKIIEFKSDRYSWLNLLPKYPIILDIGCGDCKRIRYGKYFRNDAQYYGIDLKYNIKCNNILEKFITLNIVNDNIPFEKNYFDAIILSHIIEHLPNDALDNILQKILFILKKDGILFLVTENWTSIFLPPFYNFYHDPTHIRPYTKYALIKLCNLYELDPIIIKPIRIKEFIFFAPFFPIVNLLKLGRWEFMPYEILGPKIYCIAKKS